MFNGGVLKNVIVIAKYEGERAKPVDHFLGKLLELRTTEAGYYDMVMSYKDRQIGTVTVLHKFEDYYFKPIEVLELNDAYIKEEFKDSLYAEYLKDFRCLKSSF